MPFIPHTDDEVQQMLRTINVDTIEALFDEIPAGLKEACIDHLPPGITEMQLMQLMRQRAEQDSGLLGFIGAGAYEHHIPAAVWDITTRGEFYTAYTPYQAEASQGTLQLLYEFQTLMARLTGLDASNASLYDGASALAEAVLMAIRVQGKSSSRNILVPSNIHPLYREVLDAIVVAQKVHIKTIAMDEKTGTISSLDLQRYAGESFSALIIPQPNFFGGLEAVDELTDWAHAQQALVIGLVNPTALALLKPPGDWGTKGADIACGEGQPLGIPVSSGGPYFGFICCKMDLIRQMPGRIIGRTVDTQGRQGFTLTLQAREQHIRRAKATSNICTNQGLMVTASTIYMSLLGSEGLAKVAAHSHANTVKLVEALCAIPGVSLAFQGTYFHEAVLLLSKSASKSVDVVLAELAAQGILGGLALAPYYPHLHDCLLVCATETKTPADIEQYARVLKSILQTDL